jgi:hypothetical protein
MYVAEPWSSRLRGPLPARPARRRLRSGSCTSARGFAPRFLPTVGRPSAVAVRFDRDDLLSVGLAPTRQRPCGAHKTKARARRARASGRALHGREPGLRVTRGMRDSPARYGLTRGSPPMKGRWYCALGWTSPGMSRRPGGSRAARRRGDGRAALSQGVRWWRPDAGVHRGRRSRGDDHGPRAPDDSDHSGACAHPTAGTLPI